VKYTWPGGLWKAGSSPKEGARSGESEYLNLGKILVGCKNPGQLGAMRKETRDKIQKEEQLAALYKPTSFAI